MSCLESPVGIGAPSYPAGSFLEQGRIMKLISSTLTLLLPCSPSPFPVSSLQVHRLHLSGPKWDFISPTLSITEVLVLLASASSSSNKFRSSSNTRICLCFDCLIYTIRAYLLLFPLASFFIISYFIENLPPHSSLSLSS